MFQIHFCKPDENNEYIHRLKIVCVSCRARVHPVERMKFIRISASANRTKANEKKCERQFRCEKTLQSIKYNCSRWVVCADIVKIKCPCCSHVYVEWETDGVHVSKMHTCRLRNLYSSLFFLFLFFLDSRCCAVSCFRFTCISSQTARSVVRLTRWSGETILSIRSLFVQIKFKSSTLERELFFGRNRVACTQTRTNIKCVFFCIPRAKAICHWIHFGIFSFACECRMCCVQRTLRDVKNLLFNP